MCVTRSALIKLMTPISTSATWNDIADRLVAVFKQLYLAIEESHSPNNGQTKGGGENQFVQHLSSLCVTRSKTKSPAFVALVSGPNRVKTGHQAFDFRSTRLGVDLASREAPQADPVRSGCPRLIGVVIAGKVSFRMFGPLAGFTVTGRSAGWRWLFQLQVISHVH
jgi:hypothetical protein